ncbi:MAG: NAD(P)-dependent oxidoreductase [Pseudomonadota bacterium]
MTGRVGYVGLGAMGAPMLKRLAEGADKDSVLGFDADKEVTARACADAGATACHSLEEIALRADVLFTCLPNNAVLEQVYLGPGGVAGAIRPGSVTIDCSTVGPDATRRVHAGLAEKGVAHLDASMLGSVAQAETGQISFVVGGEEDALARVIGALQKVGGLIRYCGPSGSGNQMKLLHQTLVAGHAVAVAEAITLAKSVGADVRTFYDIVTQGTGFAYSRYFEKRVPRMEEGDFSALFMLKFMLKDARLAADMTPDKDLLPALGTVIETLQEGVEQGLGEEDFSAAMKVVAARFQV